MTRRQSWTIAATLAGVVSVSCGDHIHQLVPSDTTRQNTDEQPNASGGGDASSETATSIDVGGPAEVPDASSGPTGLWIADPTPALASQAPSCLECAQANCEIYVAGCALIAGDAIEGPAKGTPKAELCVETLACVLSTGCASCATPNDGCAPLTKYGNCYCLEDAPSVKDIPTLCNSPTPDIEGPCKSTLERSLETTRTSTVLASFGDPSKGGSWAMMLMQCLVDNRCQSCFPTPDAGLDAGDSDAP